MPATELVEEVLDDALEGCSTRPPLRAVRRTRATTWCSPLARPPRPEEPAPAPVLEIPRAAPVPSLRAPIPSIRTPFVAPPPVPPFRPSAHRARRGRRCSARRRSFSSTWLRSEGDGAHHPRGGSSSPTRPGARARAGFLPRRSPTATGCSTSRCEAWRSVSRRASPRPRTRRPPARWRSTPTTPSPGPSTSASTTRRCRATSPSTTGPSSTRATSTCATWVRARRAPASPAGCSNRLRAGGGLRRGGRRDGDRLFTARQLRPRRRHGLQLPHGARPGDPRGGRDRSHGAGPVALPRRSPRDRGGPRRGGVLRHAGALRRRAPGAAGAPPGAPQPPAGVRTPGGGRAARADARRGLRGERPLLRPRRQDRRGGREPQPLRRPDDGADRRGDGARAVQAGGRAHGEHRGLRHALRPRHRLQGDDPARRRRWRSSRSPR